MGCGCSQPGWPLDPLALRSALGDFSKYLYLYVCGSSERDVSVARARASPSAGHRALRLLQCGAYCLLSAAHRRRGAVLKTCNSVCNVHIYVRTIRRRQEPRAAFERARPRGGASPSRRRAGPMDVF